MTGEHKLMKAEDLGGGKHGFTSDATQYSEEDERMMGINRRSLNALVKLARAMNTIIAVRITDQTSMDIFKTKNYAAKGLNVHDKSSNWGFHKGMVPVDPWLSKKSGMAKDYNGPPKKEADIKAGYKAHQSSSVIASNYVYDTKLDIVPLTLSSELFNAFEERKVPCPGPEDAEKCPRKSSTCMLFERPRDDGGKLQSTDAYVVMCANEVEESKYQISYFYVSEGESAIFEKTWPLDGYPETKESVEISGGSYENVIVWAYDGVAVTGDVDLFGIYPNIEALDRIIELQHPSVSMGLGISFPGLTEDSQHVRRYQVSSLDTVFLRRNSMMHALRAVTKAVPGGESTVSNLEYYFLNMLNAVAFDADNADHQDTCQPLVRPGFLEGTEPDGLFYTQNFPAILVTRTENEKKEDCVYRPPFLHGPENRNKYFVQEKDKSIGLIYPDSGLHTAGSNGESRPFEVIGEDKMSGHMSYLAKQGYLVTLNERYTDPDPQIGGKRAERFFAEDRYEEWQKMTSRMRNFASEIVCDHAFFTYRATEELDCADASNSHRTGVGPSDMLAKSRSDIMGVLTYLASAIAHEHQIFIGVSDDAVRTYESELSDLKKQQRALRIGLMKKKRHSFGGVTSSHIPPPEQRQRSKSLADGSQFRFRRSVQVDDNAIRKWTKKLREVEKLEKAERSSLNDDQIQKLGRKSTFKEELERARSASASTKDGFIVPPPPLPAPYHILEPSVQDGPNFLAGQILDMKLQNKRRKISQLGEFLSSATLSMACDLFLLDVILHAVMKVSETGHDVEDLKVVAGKSIEEQLKMFDEKCLNSATQKANAYEIPTALLQAGQKSQLLMTRVVNLKHSALFGRDMSTRDDLKALGEKLVAEANGEKSPSLDHVFQLALCYLRIWVDIMKPSQMLTCESVVEGSSEAPSFLRWAFEDPE
eukprot:g4918.t1